MDILREVFQAGYADMNFADKVETQFGVSPAEAAVLMTVGYEIPLPRERFIPHAVWESLREFSEAQISKALDDCEAKGWIFLTVQSRPEFTEQGEKLWNAIRRAISQWSKEAELEREEKKRHDEEIRRNNKLAEWRKWNDDWRGNDKSSSP